MRNPQMTSAQTASAQAWSLMGQAELPPSVLFGETEMELWPYRRRTVALLRRYARASVEVGRLPSLLGREFFRTRVTSYTMRNFEDVVIFVTDMEQAIEKLTAREKKLLAMNILEEYTVPEVARLLGCNQRMVERLLQDALDQLSRTLLAGGLMEKLPSATRGRETCQEGKNYNLGVSDSKEGKNKYRKFVGTPPSDLIS
jgi:Sigma-70, region 4